MKSQATYPTTVNEEDIQRYRDQGFLLTRDVLTASEIEQFRTAVDREVAIRTADDHRTLEQKSTYEQSFVQCMRLWETAPADKTTDFSSGPGRYRSPTAGRGEGSTLARPSLIQGVRRERHRGSSGSDFLADWRYPARQRLDTISKN